MEVKAQGVVFLRSKKYDEVLPLLSQVPLSARKILGQLAT